MEQLKVKKKDSIIINVIIYLILSYFFLYLQHAYHHHLSPFSWIYLRKSAELFWYVAIPIVSACVLLWRHHNLAVLAYSICTLLVGFKVVEGLFIEFNKIIVIALFLYAVISYFLFQLLSHYLSLASINPNYAASDLFAPLLQPISCVVEVGGVSHAGILTNWDDDGCFVKLDQAFKVVGDVSLKVQFQGREFVQAGEVVAHTLNDLGLGIKFLPAHKDLHVFNWSEFNELVEELGFRPERLR